MTLLQKIKNITNTIVFKIAFWFSAISLLLVFSLSIISYFFLSGQYYRTSQASLSNQFILLEQEVNDASSNDDVQKEIYNFKNQGYEVAIEDMTGTQTNFALFDKMHFEAGKFHTIEGNRQHHNDIMVYMNTLQGKKVYISKSVEDFERTKESFITVLISANILCIVIFLLVSFLLSRFILRPITKISNYLSDQTKGQYLNYQPLHDGGQPMEVSILTKSFDDAIVKINDVVRREREFLQDASHELRTPLMGILSSLELIDSKEMNLSQIEKLSTITLLSQKLKKITDSLLYLTREESAIQGEKEDIYVNQLIESIVDMHKQAILDKNLHVEIDSINCLVHATEIDMQKLFSNIIDNAIKYTPEGGTIKIVVGKNEVSIEDSGVGIADEVKNKIGDRFTRGIDAISMNYEGVGLGLSIVSKIIKKYNRELKVQSTTGKGTKMSIITR